MNLIIFFFAFLTASTTANGKAKMPEESPEMTAAFFGWNEQHNLNGTSSKQRMKRQQIDFPRSPTIATPPPQEYLLATSAPLMDSSRLTTWDFMGNIIVNALHRGNAQVTLRIGDQLYSSLLMADLFEAYHGFKTVVGWSRLSICYVLALRKKEDSGLGEVSFTKNDCNKLKLFKVDVFDGASDVIWKRMDNCYNKPAPINAYSKCLRRNLPSESAHFRQEDPCKVLDLDGSNVANNVFGSHLREICLSTSEQITNNFESRLESKEESHDLAFFDIEVCYLQSYFRKGSMTICFPAFPASGSASAHSYSPECGFNANKLQIVYKDPLSLALIIGNSESALNAKRLINVELLLEPKVIKCGRLAFNRYTSEGADLFWDKKQLKKVGRSELASSGIWPIPTELLQVKGRYGLVADEVNLVITNSFESSFFFLRMGRCPNVIRCYWAFTPTLSACNNIGGMAPKKCSYTIQSSVATSSGIEISSETGEQEKTSIGAGVVIKDALKLDISHEYGSHSNRVQKFLDNLQRGRSQSVTEEVMAPAGERLEVWQLSYTCLDHRYFLPVLEQKNANNSDESIPSMAHNPYSGWRRIDDEAASKEEEEKSKEEGQQHFAEMPSPPLRPYKGKCDFPVVDKHYYMECQAGFRVPEDLGPRMAKMIENCLDCD